MAPPTKLGSLITRLSITLGAPFALFLGEAYLTLPEVPAENAGAAPGLSLFGLGLAPIIGAYVLVEVVAFLVPSWSRLRHGNPEGRAKLDRAVVFTTIALAFALGLHHARTLTPRFQASVAIITITLVAGVCIQFLVAQLISRQGLLNGFVTIFAANFVRDLVEGPRAFRRWLSATGMSDLISPEAILTPAKLTMGLFAIGVVALATWIALRDAARNVAKADADGAPYRSDRKRAVAPMIPVPSGSLWPLSLAPSVLAMPQMFATWGLTSFQSIEQALLDERVFALALFALTAGTTWVLARVLHRPAELADLVERLGAKADDTFREQTRASIQAAFWPSLLFITVLSLTGFGLGHLRVSSVLVVTLIAAMLDLAHSLRIEMRQGDWVSIWQERRATAVPVLRAALADDGIATETRGAHILNLMQVFAPQAP